SPPSPPPPPPPPSGASGASGTTGASDSTQAPPPPPSSSSTHQGGQSTSTAAPSSSKSAASAEYPAWTTTDTRIKPSITIIPDDLYMDDETTADEQAYSSGDEVGRDHIPTVNLRQSWWKPLTEDRPATPEPAWTIPSSDLTMPTNNWASALKNLVIRKRVEDFQLGIESYQTQLNLTKPRWEATSLEFMHDYKILDSPRAILFRDKYGMQMLMRFNEIHKFSDGTLQQIDEALDYRVKEFKVNKINPGLNTRTWKALLVEEYEKETTDFYGELNDDIFSIASSTSCVDYIKMEMQIPRSSRVKFIATCSYSRLNDCITSRKNDPKLPQTLISMSSSVCQRYKVMY
ncbi:hypothetical protein Tco_0617958, partial [Tanacetum coccineum]